MADFVLGLAKSAVEGTVSIAKSAVEEGNRLHTSVQRDLMLISDEFEMMNSFLSVAKDHGAADDVTRTLVRQVRNMALDTEDCIETVVSLDNNPHWCRRLLPSCMPAAAPVLALEDAVAGLELLKARVDSMGQRNIRYSHIGDYTTKPTVQQLEALPNSTASNILAATAMFDDAREEKSTSWVDLVALINKKHMIFEKDDDHIHIEEANNNDDDTEEEEANDDEDKEANDDEDEEANDDEDKEAKDDAVHMIKEKDGDGEEGKLIKRLRSLDYLDNKSGWSSPKSTRSLVEDIDLEKLFDKNMVRSSSPRVQYQVEYYDSDGVNSVSSPVTEMKTWANKLSEFLLSPPESTKENKSPYVSRASAANGVDLQLQVISVLTTDNQDVVSIKKAYDHPETKQSFILRAWVKMMHPFHHSEFMSSLLVQFSNNYCAVQEENTVDVPDLMTLMTGDGIYISEFMKRISNHKYLVILEDVSSMCDWETVRVWLPDMNNGSCIIVHTQQLGIASLCVGHPQRISQLEKYSVNHSVRVIFKEDAARNDEGTAAKKKAARDWRKKNKLVGRVTDRWNMNLNAICREDILVVSVWGVAGVGKSSLVKETYFKEMLKPRTYNKFGWVNLAHPFNLLESLRNLLLDMHSESIQHCNMLTTADLMEECRQLFHGNKCLVVIDGLQSTEEWDSIKGALTFVPSNSCIIVITTEESVAQYCTPPTQGVCLNVKGLQIDMALKLFKSKVTGWPSLNPEETQQAMLILHKCGGLPKVIVSIAEVLSTNTVERLGWLSIGFMYRLEHFPWFHSLQDTFAWLHSYFRFCPDFLKPCIFYLSIFPGNHSIRRRRLLRRWIAEGYSRDDKGKTAEETSEEYFSKLEEVSMIQRPEPTAVVGFGSVRRMPLCQVSGFFREYISSRSMEDNLVFALKNNCSMNSQHTGRHLVIEESWDRDKNVFESIDLSRLRSLTVFGVWKRYFMSSKLKLLRVLDLEDASDVKDGDLDQIGKLLPHLKFLSLRGCDKIHRLPNSLRRLRQLQTLDIRHTSVTALPATVIVKLKKLQYIRAGSRPAPSEEASTSSKRMAFMPCTISKLCRCQLANTNHVIGVQVSRQIGKFASMHTLGVVDIRGDQGKTILKQLKKLTQLHKLGVSGVGLKNSDKFFSAISGHAHLTSLSVGLKKGSKDGCLDGICSPPVNLRSLKLYGLVRELPLWIKELRFLRKLSLQMTMLPQEGMDFLLDRLVSLRLSLSEFQDDELHFGRQHGFDNVSLLEISSNSSLEKLMIKFHERKDRQPTVKILRIRCCHVSSLRFSGLEHISLNEVWLSGIHLDTTLKQHLESELARCSRQGRKPVLRLEEPGSWTPWLRSSS